ncbi:branched-chain amino acid transport system substrate-binding protein [Bradyrhizobium sp. NFR13]|uniref:amino acid ABC transporter substrate-binding protein n=1 Tax=Bradyrhizobium sp. NFR13 TaxID=1566285 RepID=UPI0008EDDA46|nr:amino acid ABC transporter substrate-binding protein [Bradyrhizobium sp. NFR13]SFL72615.1 branched-chain amino acid transport system substrate-binding protein [Bradyrhizobium sp. NFR13]
MVSAVKRLAAGLLAVAGAAAVGWGGAAEAQTSVKIGYAISRTGPAAGGAAVTTIPNYELWVKEVNAAGGLKLGDKRVPIEVVQYDDRSSAEEAAKALERLITQDKVDFILPPWGTGLNLAVGPILNKAGYPHIASTAVTDRAPELAKRWPNSFWLLGTSADAAKTLVELLTKLRTEGKIGDTVAMASIADGFGIDLSGAARPALTAAKFKLAYDKTYPVGTQDLSPIINEVKALNPDVFIAFSYPPDTIAITEQSRISGFNPKVFYTGVGTAFPLFKQKFGANAEGVMGIGGWSGDSPVIKDYLARHKASAANGAEPDRWASAVTYAGLQMLQQAIERVGKVDRAAVIKDLQTGTFDTVIGKVKLENNMPTKYWWVGQWQDGEFYGIGPSGNEGARAPVVPKPAWKAQ